MIDLLGSVFGVLTLLTFAFLFAAISAVPAEKTHPTQSFTFEMLKGQTCPEYFPRLPIRLQEAILDIRASPELDIVGFGWEGAEWRYIPNELAELLIRDFLLPFSVIKDEEAGSRAYFSPSESEKGPIVLVWQQFHAPGQTQFLLRVK